MSQFPLSKCCAACEAWEERAAIPKPMGKITAAKKQREYAKGRALHREKYPIKESK